MKKILAAFFLFFTIISSSVFADDFDDWKKNQPQESRFSEHDLVENPSGIKGKLVTALFTVIQKINSKSYLVSTLIPAYAGHTFFIQKATIKQRSKFGYKKDFNFDFVDGQNINVVAIVNGPTSYENVQGSTSTVIKLTIVEIVTHIGSDEGDTMPLQAKPKYSGIDLYEKGLQLKGHKVEDCFKVIQKNGLNKYLVTLSWHPDSPDKWPNYYLTKDTHAHFDFDFVDDESIYLTAIVGGPQTYEEVSGGTATVITLKAVEKRPCN